MDPVAAGALEEEPGDLPPPLLPPLPALPSASARVRSLLPLAVQERLDLDRRAVVGLCVLLVLALGYGVQHFWVGRPEPVAVPVAETAGTATAGATAASVVSPEPTVGGTGTAPKAAGAAGATGGVIVDVAGRVRRPGVRTLRPGARVQDALRAAGGALAGTDLTNLNLARIVNDGEEIIVGGTAAAAPGGPGAPGVPGVPAAAGSPLSLNTATADQLDALPGLGPVLVQRIIQYRDQHGGFRSVDDLRQISGFGERRLKDLRALLRP
ncbi:ComEA family DNA-binding protein [Streptacidiphilus sp. N1-3]|uniref:ComEA family DNA-binding protein n=1 Tax=Streptacidiphilus alkalitolerans TaxID=3342712 RepID=A0ABV6WU18_9ACTN